MKLDRMVSRRGRSRSKLLRRLPAEFGILSAVALLLASCGSSTSSPASSSSSLFGSVVATAPTGASIAGPWVAWDKASCSYKEMSQHPSSYPFVLKKANHPLTIAYAEYSSSQAATFIVANNTSLGDNASKAGITIKTYNNDYPSQTAPITAAQDMIAIHPDIVLNANAVDALYPAIFSRLKAACIPTYVMYLTEKGYPMFGTNWETAGTSAGQYAASQIQKKGWNPSDVSIYICADKAVGQSVEAAEGSFQAAIQKGVSAIPSGNYYKVECGPTQDSAGAPTSAWLNSHPNTKYLVTFGLNDEITAGASNALARGGRKINDDTLVIGTGVDGFGVQEIYGGHETASVTFFPERYGNYIVPELESILAGDPIPSAAGPPAIALDASNIGQYYPKP